MRCIDETLIGGRCVYDEEPDNDADVNDFGSNNSSGSSNGGDHYHSHVHNVVNKSTLPTDALSVEHPAASSTCTDFENGNIETTHVNGADEVEEVCYSHHCMIPSRSVDIVLVATCIDWYRLLLRPTSHLQHLYCPLVPDLITAGYASGSTEQGSST